ncbi:hypothetical protein FRB96_008960 [Tulasnella sp. 330]|nr:hypothetical protein FRB96_008960 [Tulasnella sp. 330]
MHPGSGRAENRQTLRHVHGAHWITFLQGYDGAAAQEGIYEVSVKYDVIVCEDDPYYFLQEGPYVPWWYRWRKASAAMDPDEGFETLSPRFLKFDHEGRITRLDPFFKVNES